MTPFPSVVVRTTQNYHFLTPPFDPSNHILQYTFFQIISINLNQENKNSTKKVFKKKKFFRFFLVEFLFFYSLVFFYKFPPLF